MSINSIKYSLIERAYMLNGIQWLKKHFSLPVGYQYDVIWNTMSNCPNFYVLRLDLKHKENLYIAQTNNIIEPWIDTLFESEQAKNLLNIIKWNTFDQFEIIDNNIIKEILSMDTPLDAYRLCVNDYIIEKEKFYKAKSLESYLLLNEHEIIGKFYEVHKTMEEKYGYTYIKTITEKNNGHTNMLHVYYLENPIEYYTMFKLQER